MLTLLHLPSHIFVDMGLYGKNLTETHIARVFGGWIHRFGYGILQLNTLFTQNGLK